MKFEVELTERADRDLRNIFLYIAFDLSAPDAIRRALEGIWGITFDDGAAKYLRRYPSG